MHLRLALFAGIAGLGCAIGPVMAAAEVPQVATDIAPVHSLVARVMQGVGEPAMVVQPAASPHAYALRPSEARMLQGADAVFWVGPELEPWLSNAIANLAADAVTVALLDRPETRVLAFRTGVTFAAPDHQGDDHDEGAQATGGPGRDTAHGGEDPHAWLDPANAAAWLDVIAEELGRLDPANAEVYAANAEAGRAEIAETVREVEALIAPARSIRFVVFHDAYHYFEDRFGIPAAGAIELGDASDPSPARIEEVRGTVEALDVACVFSEPQYNQSLVSTVIEGTEARAGTIDPLGAGIPAGPDFYPQLLLSVARELNACAG